MGERSNQERDRPDPEELLDRYQLRDQPPGSSAPPLSEPSGARADSHVHRRGRLRIYLGMAAGVGKTYAMLNEGRRRKSRGTDVAVGYVETHKRPLTEQQIGDLEVIPRRHVTYRGVTLEEMDIDAIIKRHPQVALVDELAHTNAPGSPHEKRYEDVEDLLNAGITVISTLNVQHLEGLNDIVEAITGVRQRETLPDRILDEADEVELVDISPDALRSRLRHGNVYPRDRAERALANYFSQSNLTALRELALRRVADKTEAQLDALVRRQESRDEPAWAATATERVMVAFDARPHARQLIRDAWRLAHGLRAPLLAVTVVPRRAGSGQASGKDAIEEYLLLAEDLGAEVIRIEGRNVAEELARVARERHVTQIVVGQPERSGWLEALRGSVVDRLLRYPTGADIHVVPQQRHRD